MIPERFTYQSVNSDDCVGGGYIIRKFLVETFYDESISLDVARNDLAHNLFDVTREFQKIDWRELARRLIVSITFLDEKVVCTYSDIDATDLDFFEKWLTQR